MPEGKYIVIKQKAWEDFLVDMVPHLSNSVGAALNGMLETGEVDDAVVIRRQDAFAPPALDGYANSITVAIEAIRNANDGEDITEEAAATIRRLTGISDYFHSQARLSWDTNRKLPD